MLEIISNVYCECQNLIAPWPYNQSLDGVDMKFDQHKLAGHYSQIAESLYVAYDDAASHRSSELKG